ncbi:MAG: TIGR00730 family Rossman fold protein [Planctomycetota bacterium]|nr:TIGR00730 family Rossman fold protein [Planctomycetota bacterium]
MTAPIAAIAVFCGASHGARHEYTAQAFNLGRAIASRGLTLVYGGGRAGLMGAVADASLGAGGRVIGVITELLKGRELGHTGIHDLKVVPTMHERKMLMADMADAFVALPGGLGTLDELFEILAWAQLGIHTKPVGILNVEGYYDELMAFLDHVERENFLRLNHRTEVVFERDVDALLDRLAHVRSAGARFPA